MRHTSWSCLQDKYRDSNLLLPALTASSNGASDVPAPIVEQFVSAPLPRAAGLALVDDWDCLRVRPCSCSFDA